MKAILIHQFGGPEVLKLEHVSRPEPKAREVLVRIRAASINPVDWQTRAGFGMAEQIRSFPVVLGWDLSGEIEAIGAGVMRFKIGDQVYGMPRYPELASTYAEYAVAPEQDLAFKPRNLTHREAAAMPLAALTAHQALEAMKLQAGQTLLVHAAAGGVGHFALQLARARGASVIGMDSHHNRQLIRDLGAEFLDDTLEPFERHLEPVDAVLDALGGEVQARSLEVIKPGGYLVSLIEPVPESLHVHRPGVHTRYIVVKPSGLHLEHLAGLVERGQLKPTLSQIFPLEQVVEAHRFIEQHYVSGKIVLEMTSNPV